MAGINAPLPLLPAHIEETNPVDRSAPRRASSERHAASARRRSHNSITGSPALHRRPDRPCGRLDRGKFASYVLRRDVLAEFFQPEGRSRIVVKRPPRDGLYAR
jgi:hypothetical protein